MTDSDPLPPLRAIPEGPEATLRALARAMFRNTLIASAAVSAVAFVVSGVLVGLAGVMTSLLAVIIAVGSSLLTLVLIHRTAALAPNVVMLVSLGGLLMKAIVLLVALFVLGGLPGVHRESLVLTLLALFIAIAAAEGWAGYRLQTLTLHIDTD